MEIILLLYNITLTSMLTLAIACAYYLYIRRKNNVYAITSVLFLLYLIDNTIVFCTESISDFADSYDKLFIASPSFKTIYFVGLFTCILFIYFSVIKPKHPYWLFILLGAYAILLICIPIIPQANWMVWFYYLVNQSFLIGLTVYGLAFYRREPDLLQTAPHSSFRKVLLFMFFMCVAILIEDSVVIFYFDVYSQNGLKINNRNWTENLLYLGLCISFIRYTLDTIGHGEAMPEIPEQPPQESSAREFGNRYLLTDREQEILAELLNGKGLQEISSDLIIAPGTVKTHIHNIYQKVDVSKRDQLVQKYQEFCRRPVASDSSGKTEVRPSGKSFR